MKPQRNSNLGRRLASASSLLLCLRAPAANASVLGLPDPRLECMTVKTVRNGDANTSCGARDPNGELIFRNEGKLSLRKHAYDAYDAAKYAPAIVRGLVEVQKSAYLLDELDFEVRSESGRNGVRALFQELLSLGAAHKREWNDRPREDGAPRDLADDHFDKAVNAHEAALEVYSRVWDIMKGGAEAGGNAPFSIRDQVTILSGLSSANNNLHTLFRESCVSRDQDPSTYPLDDCSVAYHYFARAVDWDEISFEVVTLSGDSTLLLDAKQTQARIKVRFGVFLVDMFDAGYVRGDHGSLSLAEKKSWDEEKEEGSTEDGTELTEPIKKLLLMSLLELTMGLTLYSELSAAFVNGSDLRMDLAEITSYIGRVLNHLQDWESGIQQLKSSIASYESLLIKYRANEAKSVRIASKMAAPLRQLNVAYVNMPGKTDGAKSAFKKLISCYRFAQDKIPFQEPLEDGTHYPSSVPQKAFHHQDALDEYEAILDRHLREDIALMLDSASYSQSESKRDNTFEGGLRSYIGELNLMQGDYAKAYKELKLSVELLRKGISNSDDSKLTGKRGAKIELAKTLVKFAYALAELKKWRSSYIAYEEAMDIYAAELKEGETPMKNSALAEDDDYVTKEVHPWIGDESNEADDGIVWGQYIYVGNKNKETNHTGGFII